MNNIINNYKMVKRGISDRSPSSVYRIILVLGITILCSPSLFAQYTAQQAAQKKVFKLMGCRFEVSAVADNDKIAWQAINTGIDEMERIERLISSWDENSQTSAINRNAGIEAVKVDKELFNLIYRAKKIAKLTKGAFDISNSFKEYKSGIKNATVNNLMRPVHLSHGDLTGNGREDFVVSEYGNMLGALSWIENRTDGSYQRHELFNDDRSTKTEITDVNGEKDCPIYYLNSITTKQLDEGSTKELKVTTTTTQNTMEFVVDPLKEVKHELDIQEYKFGTKMEVSQAQQIPQEGEELTELASSMSFTLAGDGSMVSKTKGKATFAIEMSSASKMLVSFNNQSDTVNCTDPSCARATSAYSLSSDTDTNIKLTMTFEDGTQAIGYHTAKVTVVSDELLTQEEKYYINGQVAEKNEFYDLFSMEVMSTTPGTQN